MTNDQIPMTIMALGFLVWSVISVLGWLDGACPECTEGLTESLVIGHFMGLALCCPRMVVNTKQLTGLPVFTKSGVGVGRVAGFDIDTDTGRLRVLRVKTRGFVPGLLNQELAISWNQVVELTNERAVVEDGAIPVRARALAIRPTATGGGIHMSTRNSAIAGNDA